MNKEKFKISSIDLSALRNPMLGGTNATTGLLNSLSGSIY